MSPTRLTSYQKELLDSLKEKDEKKILFVCLGNICRSPAAEGVMKSIIEEGDNPEFSIDSAGTGGWHVGELPDKRMRIHAGRRGLSLNHRCRRVSSQDFEDFDLVIGMDDSNISDLRGLAPSVESARKIMPMAAFVDESFHYDHVPDPYYSGSEGFELVLDLLENGCRNLFNLLK